jgi:hypothetical protein
MWSCFSLVLTKGPSPKGVRGNYLFPTPKFDGYIRVEKVWRGTQKDIRMLRWDESGLDKCATCVHHPRFYNPHPLGQGVYVNNVRKDSGRAREFDLL